MNALFHSIKPNTALLAYGLFLATNAMSIWGGVFPFLPLTFQTPQLLFWFFLAQATLFSCTFFMSAACSYFFPHMPYRRMIILAASCYFTGWAALILSTYLASHTLILIGIAGVFLGAGSAGYYLLFQRLFVSQEATSGMHNIILGSAYAALIYFMLYAVPTAVTVYLAPLVFMPLFTLALIINARAINEEQPMFVDIPREHPHVYKRTWLVFWRSALCMASLGLCTGIMRARAIDNPQVGSYVNVLSMSALLIAALTFLLLWKMGNVSFNVLAIYRVLFPLILTALALLAFLPIGYTSWLAAGLYAIYSVALLLLMLQAGCASRDYGVNPLFLFGLMGGVVFLLHDVGFIAGSFVNIAFISIDVQPSDTALLAVWILSVIYFVTHHKLRSEIASAFNNPAIELPDSLFERTDKQHTSSKNKLEKHPYESADAFEKTAADHTQSCNTAQNKALQIKRGNDIAGETPVKAPSSNISNKESAHQHKNALHESHAKRSQHPARSMFDTKEAVSDDMKQDRIELHVDAVRKAFNLSAREAEVVNQIVRGKTAACIAEELFVSLNTINTHTRRIYTKLGIHKKDELVKLVEQAQE